jgi:hypothetical protein
MLAGSGPPPSPGARQIFGVSGPSSIGHLRGAGAASAVVSDCAKAAPPTLCIILRRENRNPISETSPIKLVAARTPAGVKLETLAKAAGATSIPQTYSIPIHNRARAVRTRSFGFRSFVVGTIVDIMLYEI